MKDPVLILGAGSDMGQAIAQAFAAEGHGIQLAARRPGEIEDVARDLELRHRVTVSTHAFDVLETGEFEAFIAALPALPEVAVCVVGAMGDQATSEGDMDAASLVMRTNYEGPALILGALANAFAARGSGTLVGVSSVAGLRGRASNYVYGASKAGFTAFLSGLRNRFAKTPVHVVTVLPGFVATKMTEGLDLNPKLTAQPAEVGQAVLRAVERRRNLIYVRPIWWVIMSIIRALPEPIFKKTSL